MVKKMILVPHESVAQLQSELPKPPAPVGSFSKMDTDMERILADKHLNEFDKYMQYESVLQRYMSKLSRQKKDVAVFLDAEEEETPPKIAPPTPVKEEKYTYDSKNIKGPLLFAVLSKTAGVDISADGDLKLKGKVLGNVDSLIDGALRNKQYKPEGWDDFSKILKNINLPLSFVNNIELKNYIKDKPQPNEHTRKIPRERLRSPYNGPNE
jgi:hypothetical protein